jgi:hypothetical protein
MARGPFLARLLEACREHGEQSEPDMEVGDLQQIVRDMWLRMTPQQQRAMAPEWRAFIDEWLDRPVKVHCTGGGE